MIRYALVCDQTHTWDAWFDSMSGYDDQVARGLVECPFCGSKSVRKAPMAPSIATSSSNDRGQRHDGATGSIECVSPHAVEGSGGALGVPEPLQAMLQSWKEHIAKNYTYVGDRFAQEVRDISDGVAENRLIYGQATLAEAKALIEDGLPVAPLPPMASPKPPKGVH
jgi:hypothetical protein